MDDLDAVIKELIKKKVVVERGEENLAQFDQVIKPPSPQVYYASVELLQAYMAAREKFYLSRDELVTRLEIDRMAFYKLESEILDAIPPGLWVKCEGYNFGITRFRAMGVTTRRLIMVPVGADLPELL